MDGYLDLILSVDTIRLIEFWYLLSLFATIIAHIYKNFVTTDIQSFFETTHNIMIFVVLLAVIYVVIKALAPPSIQVVMLPDILKDILSGTVSGIISGVAVIMIYERVQNKSRK